MCIAGLNKAMRASRSLERYLSVATTVSCAPLSQYSQQVAGHTINPHPQPHPPSAPRAKSGPPAAMVFAGRWEQGELAVAMEEWQCALAAETAHHAALAARRCAYHAHAHCIILNLCKFPPCVLRISVGSSAGTEHQINAALSA